MVLNDSATVDRAPRGAGLERIWEVPLTFARLANSANHVTFLSFLRQSDHGVDPTVDLLLGGMIKPKLWRTMLGQHPASV